MVVRAMPRPAGRMPFASVPCAGTSLSTCTAASEMTQGRSVEEATTMQLRLWLGFPTQGGDLSARSGRRRPAHLLARAVDWRLAAPIANGLACLPAPVRASSPTGGRRRRP